MKLIQRKIHWVVAVSLIAAAALYYGLFASDRYVSEAKVVLQSPEVATQSFSLGSLLSGGGNAGELLLLKEHLLSVDMINKLDKQLQLRAHYSQNNIDWLSRLSDANTPMEYFVDYMHQRIYIEFDDYTATLRVRVQAYSPEMAKQMAQLLLQDGESHMNLMAQNLAQEQVRFIETQVEQLAERLQHNRNQLLQFQNQHGLVSPAGSVQSIVHIVSGLEQKLAQAQATLAAALAFQSQTSPDVLKIKNEISALQKQIQIEKSKTATSDGEALNKLLAQYQSLELQANFSLELYSTALKALESTRVEAARKLKQVSVLQTPTMPEYSTEPKRLFNWFVFSLFVLFAAAIVQLTAGIVREHRES